MLAKDVQDKIYEAYQATTKLLIEDKPFQHIYFKKYFEMYVFTTENIRENLYKLIVCGKRILTVTSSGDYLINLALLGASSIHNFDRNENAYYMTQLKLAALKTLSYEEFLQFFTDSMDRKIVHFAQTTYYEKIDENPFTFDYKTYLCIRENLKEDCALYWDMLYEKYHFDGLALMLSGIIYGKDRTSAIYNNQYLQSEEEYLKAREAIQQVDMKFFSLNVIELDKLPYTYDLIFLSNIYEYITDYYCTKITEDDFNNYLTEQLNKRLKRNGLMAMTYKFNYKMKNSAYKPSLKNLFKGKWQLDKRESLEKFTSKKILVPSVTREYRQDGAMDCVYLQSKRR